MTGTPHRRRHPPAVYERRRLALAVGLTIVVLVGPVAARSFGSDGGHAVDRAPAGRPQPAVVHQPPHPRVTPPGRLAAGSRPSVLPGPVLVADRSNDRLLVIDPQGRVRWQFPRPGDLAAGQHFPVPDDAFVSPDGRYIVATEEDAFVVSLIDVARHRIVWRYGVPGQAGSGPDRLFNPDDAMMLPDGSVLTADIKNCRVLVIPRGAHAPSRQFGRPGGCYHRPPYRLGSPNGAFPMRNGHLLVTEINGSWVSEMGLDGRVYWSVHPPAVAYPSDTNEIAPGRYLTVDYSAPGQILAFDAAGRTLWRYRPTGRSALSYPSLALPLPDGDILCNDDRNHRVIVVDPRTDRVVWQYGRTGVAGRGPGLLDNPDGVDLVPPGFPLSSVR
ncbi:MAG: PQQ-binding-like beta-propeller repeat protein [Actinomycetota bacterium]|nr:PQQ-binding-like beta-propeller repeat protein [Actinomycetota bacterium]